MFFLRKREQDKVSLFTDISPWQVFSVHGGLEFIGDNFPGGPFGVDSTRTYSPSIGFLFAPLDWLKFFADYNFDWIRWDQTYDTTRTSRGKDKVNTFSLGSDVDIIKNVLGFRIKYGFSQAVSEISNKLAGAAGESPNWPNNSNTWQELLARFEYKVHKNIAVQLGYYFNKYQSKDFGVDIMKLWMGDQDTCPDPSTCGALRSIYLGDRFKGSYTAHIAILGVKLKF